MFVNLRLKPQILKLKEYIKYLVVFVLIIVFSSFIFKVDSSTSTIDKHKLETLSKVEKKDSILEVKYPDFLTTKVNSKLDSLLQRIHKAHDFHGSLLVAKKGEILYENQIGYADFRKKELLNESSIFQLASVSKQFTAAAIMLLYERNQIQLTDSVNYYFPNFPYKNVTIINLLNHTAGLPKYFWVAEHKWKKNNAPSNAEMMGLLETSNVQRFFKPGRKFNYSNTGYFVLASIVEKISGISFSSFVKENIFDPLEMNNSYVFSFENDSIRKNQLKGYRIYKGWRHLKINNTVNDAIVGDKNVYTTRKDLYKWVVGLNNEKLLSKESLELMYSKGETMYGKEIPYGFGFRIDTKDKNAIYHYGKWNGFRTSLTQYTDDDLVVIILEHTSYNNMIALNKKIKKIVIENLDV